MFSNKDESVWHAEWGGQIIYSHSSEHSRCKFISDANSFGLEATAIDMNGLYTYFN